MIINYTKKQEFICEKCGRNFVIKISGSIDYTNFEITVPLSEIETKDGKMLTCYDCIDKEFFNATK